jgi:tripartite-type tricarboxylate transporter receptor subunit TctC
MMNIRRIVLALLCLTMAAVAVGQPKTTRLVVAFSAGGPVDSVARAISQQLGKELGRTVVVDNKPGANGAIAAMDVLRSEADGNTLWITSVGAAAINPALYDKLPYDMQRDFAPVARVVDNVELLVVGPDDPARDAAEFVENARNRKEPTSMASTGIGSIPHLAIEQLVDSTGVKLLHIPYKGAAPAITDLMGGQVGGFFGDVPGLLGHVKSGKLKALGIAATRRHPALPDVRTLEEQGIKGVDTINWYALFVSAKTPPVIVDSLGKAVRKTLETPAVQASLLQSGAVPAPSAPQELAALLEDDTKKWAKLIKAKNIKAE